MCFVWWMKEDEISPMEFLTELVDVLAADNADIAKERVIWMLEQSSFNNDDSEHLEFTTTQLQGILAIARLLSKHRNLKNSQDLINTLLTFLQSLPSGCNQESFPKWFTFDAASFFFTEFNSYLVDIVESGLASSITFSSVIVSVIEKTITNNGANSNQELPLPIRAYLTTLCNNCPALDASQVEQLSSCLLREWILPFHGLSQENFEESFNISDRSPSKDYIQSPSRESPESVGKSYNVMLKDRSPSEKHKTGSPAKNEGHNFSSAVSINENMVGKENGDNLALSHGFNNGKLSVQYIIALQEEDAHNLQKQRFAFSLMVNVLDKVRLNHMVKKGILFHQLMASAGQHLKAIPFILKLRKRDWPAEENVLKPKIHTELQICKAASSVYTKSFLSLKLEGRVVKHALRETLTILIDILDACTVSPWRRLRSCEDLFACVLRNVLDIISLCGSQDLKAILLRLKSLVLGTCAQADPWSSNQGPMFESVVKTSSDIIKSIWNTDRAAVESFLLSLAATVRDGSGKEEKMKQVNATMHLNAIQFLADTVLLMHKQEIADMLCPLFVESLEEGDASVPSRLRLQILDSVARIATLGFEKSYREAVILLMRSYMDKLATVGSTQSRTLAPEATTERVETLPKAFLTIALGLSQPKLRADYRQRLLQLCSDVGLAAEAKSGKSGADLLGPLLPSVAEICSDLDILGVIEPAVLKLFRNLWFYIVLFGLAPPIQKVQVVSKNVSSSAPSIGSMSAVALQAVAGPYLWNTQWSAAVVRITQGTPPLVGSSLKWVEDELELNELHNPGSRRSNNNEKAASAQRAALCAALKDYVETTSISTMSGVKATYFLAVAFLEILRLNYNGGVLRRSANMEKLESALSCVFEYLEKPNLAPSIYQCLVAIVHRAFDSSMAWLDDKAHASGTEAEQRQTVIITHACFLISKMAHRNESICDLACGLLDKIKYKYSQVLWNSSCLDTLLHLVQTHSSSSMDPVRGASMQALAKKQIRSWIMRSLSLAPCTTQGLLQERIRALNTWSNGSYTSDLLPLLSDIKLDPSKTDKSGNIMIPATFAASIAAAGARGWMADMGTLEVLSNGIVSANVKSSYIHINIGGLTFGLQNSTAGILFGSNTDGVTGKASDAAVSMKYILKERLIAHFLQLLQQFISKVEQGTTIETEAFRETCLRSTAFIVSELELSKTVEMESFPKLIRLLCWCPAHICSPDSMSTGVFIWTWIVSAAPHLIPVLLAELVDAWLWTIETGRGLFASGPANSGPRGRLRPHLTPGEPVIVGSKHLVDGIIAHRLWLGFVFDQFEVVRHTSADQLSLIGRLLQGSVKTPAHFSSHPAATGTFFSLMLLGLKFCTSQSQTCSASAVSISLLEDRIHRCALARFATEPEWYECNVEGFSQEEAQAISLFAQQLSLDHPVTVTNGDRLSKLSIQEGESPSSINLCSQLDNSHPVWGMGDSYGAAREKRKQLLLMLCHHEVERLDTWANPLRESFPSKLRGINSDRWIEFVKIAWSVDPRIALALPSRFPAIGSLRFEIMSLVQANISNMYHIPEALPYIITPKAAQENSPVLQLLPHWAPCSITRALEFLGPVYKRHPRIMAYVLRVLESYPAECVTFFMPQLVQILRYDDGNLVERYLITAAQRSTLFAHLLIWQLQGEEPPSTEEFSKEQLQEESAFHKVVLKVKDRIIKSFSVEALDLFEREFRFFEKFTTISGVLFPLPKDKRRAGIRRELEKIEVEGLDLYLPTAPMQLVRGIQLDSGIPLQSAAKVPIMVTFDVVDKNEPKALKSQACIFKVGDDCRQDVLALQVIALLRDIFEAVGLNLYLFPYRVLPTGCGKGIVEVVPNTRSRNQMAETTDGGLYEIFQQDFGPVGSSQFELARDNFIVSSAGYAVASLLLQPKDRHNGNLLFDNEGRLVHIDFGFILETSPGGNMRFESAQFKLSHEMTQLLDPSGVMKSDTWNRFISLCVKGYLAARQHMDSIITTVMLMVDSGLPCFSRGDPIGNLRKRFHPEMSEREAANFMIKTCEDAYNKWTTAGYDLIQYLQQGIEK